MNCISLWQPWASLCCIPHPDDPSRSVKGFETRYWQPNQRYCGELLIHAAQRFDFDQIETCKSELFKEQLSMYYNRFQDLPLGAIVGKVRLVGFHKAENVQSRLDKYAAAFGDYSMGRYAWEIVEPVLFGNKIPYKGKRRFFQVSL